MRSVAFFSVQVSCFILLAHLVIELLHTLQNNVEQTEWKYKCKCTATATLRCSHSRRDTALGEFFHLLCGFKFKLIPLFQQMKINICTKNKNQKYKPVFYCV